MLTSSQSPYLIVPPPREWTFRLCHIHLLLFHKAEMAWAPWTCPVDCSLPSSSVTKVAPYGDISGPGVSNLGSLFFLINSLTLH